MVHHLILSLAIIMQAIVDGVTRWCGSDRSNALGCDFATSSPFLFHLDNNHKFFEVISVFSAYAIRWWQVADHLGVILV